jgi:hypothetical protein
MTNGESRLRRKRLSFKQLATIAVAFVGGLAALATSSQTIINFWKTNFGRDEVAAQSKNETPVRVQAVPHTTGDAAILAPAKLAEARPQGRWVMPARFVLKQQNCSGLVEVIGTWEDGTNLGDGVAISRCNGEPPDKGRATGRFNQGHVKLTIEWDTPGRESVGIYDGAVDREGNVSGISYAQGHREWGTPDWHGTVPLERSQ